jgi:hypothetical protein
MREWLEIRDFSQGINQEEAITAGNFAWDLQDVLLSEKPELRRRGAYTNRFPTLASNHEKNRVRGYVLAAKRYAFLGEECVVVVSVDPDTETSLDVDGSTYISIIISGEAPRLLKTINGEATTADICGAWTDPGTKAESRPDAALITTDIGAWVLSFDGTDVSTLDSGTSDFFIVARRFYDLGVLKGGGFRTCAAVNGYTFLGARTGKTLNGTSTPTAPRRIWWSKLQNSEVWRDETDENYPSRGGSITLPISERIRAMEELNGQLIVFTRSTIQALTISSDPTNWDRRQRSSVGTIYARSIARYEDSLIFANKDGVFRFSGYETVNLTEEAIAQLYRDEFYQSQEALEDETDGASNRSVIGTVWGDYYLLTLGSESGTAFCCHLPTNSWVRFSNLPLTASSTGPTEDYRTFGYIKEPSSGVAYSRIVRLDPMFIPDRGHTDSYVTGGALTGIPGPTMLLELRRTSPNGLQTPKLWRSLTALYDAKNTTGTGNGLKLEYAASPDRDDAVWEEVTALPTTSSMSQERRTIAATSGAIGIRVTEQGRIGKTAIDELVV